MQATHNFYSATFCEGMRVELSGKQDGAPCTAPDIVKFLSRYWCNNLEYLSESSEVDLAVGQRPSFSSLSKYFPILNGKEVK